MKTLKYFAGLVIICAVLLFAESTRNSEAFNSPPAVSDTYRYEFTAGGTSGAENDTINIPAQFLDAWIPSVFLEATRTSGTMTLNVVLQESSKLTGTGTWIPRDSAAISNAASGRTNFNYSAAPYHMRGLRARVIIKATGSPGVVTYTGRFIAKRAN